MSNLVQKLYIQITGFLHDLVDKFGDAGRSARHGLHELQKQIGQAEESVADVQAELFLMKGEHAKALKKAADWDQLAQKSVARGDQPGAIEAVQQQVQAEELAASFGINVLRLVPMLDQLKARLSDLRQKQQDMKNRATMLDARSKVADAESRAARSLGNVGARPGVDFQQLEQQVDRKEAKAASLSVMAVEKASLDVDRRMAQSARRDAIGAKLQALGIVPTGELETVVGEGERHA